MLRSRERARTHKERTHSCVYTLATLAALSLTQTLVRA